MKIAIPLRDEHQIDDHFGHCEYYGVYTVTDKKEIETKEIIPSTQGCGCKSGIAEILAEQGVTVMLAGGIGGGAINVLNSFGIEVIRGCSGNAGDAFSAYLDGSLIDNGLTCQHHHDHHHLN